MRNLSTVLLIGVPALLAVAALLVLNEFSGPGSVEPKPRPAESSARERAGGMDPLFESGESRPGGLPGVIRRGPPPGTEGVPGEDRVLDERRLASIMEQLSGGSEGAWWELERLIRHGQVVDWLAVENALLQALREGYDNAPAFVAKLLPFLGDEGARRKAEQDLFALSLEVEDPRVLRGVFSGLGSVGGEEAAERIRELARLEERDEVFAMAVDAIARLKGATELAALLEEFAGSENREARILQGILMSRSEEMVGALAPLTFPHRSPEVRRAAVSALGQEGNPAAVEPLTMLLEREDTPAELAEMAVHSLGRVGTREAAEKLLALRQEGGEFALSAGLAMSNISSPEALPLVQKAYREEQDSTVRARLATAMGRMQSEEAVPLLTEVMGSGSERPGVRGSAALALGNIGKPESVGSLVSELESAGDTGLKEQIIQGLERMANHAPARAALVETALPRVERLIEQSSRDSWLHNRLLILKNRIDAVRPREEAEPK